ncbi:MAG: DUF4276 family protein [Fimbriimonadales bacterium]|nr:DUF4276 family protein [Fimbriimonadales bacterium]
MKDLVILVADKDAEQVLKALLSERHQSLGIRPVEYDIFVHPERDGGVRSRSAEFLRKYADDYRYALVLLDYEGCGATETASQLETKLESALNAAGWQDRVAVIVIQPELESWVFSPSPHVVEVIADGRREIYDRHCANRSGKPPRPKETMQQILREAGVPRSSALFYELARRVSLRSCADPAFQKLTRVLLRWFAQGTSHLSGNSSNHNP